MVVAPLRAGERVVGVLKVLSDKPYAFTERDVNNLQILVESLGAVIQRHRAADELQSSLDEFRNLAESMPQIVWIAGLDGGNIYFNQHWVDYTGLSLTESLGHNWKKPFHPDDQHLAWNAWSHAILHVQTYSYECRLRRSDGEFRWWLIRGEPQRDAAGKVLKWFGTCTDIHDLKEAELEITRSNRALKMLSSCSEALIRAESENEFLASICRNSVVICGYRMAWIGDASNDGEGIIRPTAHYGDDNEYLSQVQITTLDENA